MMFTEHRLTASLTECSNTVSSASASIPVNSELIQALLALLQRNTSLRMCFNMGSKTRYKAGVTFKYRKQLESRDRDMNCAPVPHKCGSSQAVGCPLHEISFHVFAHWYAHCKTIARDLP